jgi:hypothetical protein
VLSKNREQVRSDFKRFRREVIISPEIPLKMRELHSLLESIFRRRSLKRTVKKLVGIQMISNPPLPRRHQNEIVTITDDIEAALDVDRELSERLRLEWGIHTKERRNLFDQRLETLIQQIKADTSLSHADYHDRQNQKAGDNPPNAGQLWTKGDNIRLGQLAIRHVSPAGAIRWELIPTNEMGILGRTATALMAHWASFNAAAIRLFREDSIQFIKRHMDPTLPPDQAVERALEANVNPADLTPEGLKTVNKRILPVVELFDEEIKLINKERR